MASEVILSGVRENIDGSDVVWQSQPRARSSILCYVLEAGSARLARKMDTYIASTMVELPKTLERRDTGEPMYMYVFVDIDHTDYSRAASIRSYTIYSHTHTHMHTPTPPTLPLHT